MNYIEKILKKTGWVSIVEAVIFAVLGVILIWKPDETLNFISLVLGLIFIVAGGYKIITYFLAKGKYDFFNYDLIYGIMACILGAITIMYGSTIASVFRIIMGIWIIYSSVIRLSSAFKLRAIDSPIWIHSLVLAIAMFVCGLYVTFNFGAVVSTIGVVILIYAIIDIAEDAIFIKNVKEIF